MNRRTVMDRLWIIAERAKKAAVFAEHASPDQMPDHLQAIENHLKVTWTALGEAASPPPVTPTLGKE
jgi:hypothetical protein